ncbi:hypothetical protein B7P43_G12394 [Cryptotermes secundus]|uniref:EF-hand domain-containing protein n=1 Tax=Cryptotermes secundus TaxID=105785 RepID=A0A2J7PRP8_9NEOP|nr:hypothetical protein B7P43_G12394 [Cryptotermes secundus]
MTRGTRVQITGGGRRIFKGGKIQGTSPPGGTLNRVSRVVTLRHVKEPHISKGDHRAKFQDVSRPTIVSKASDRWGKHYRYRQASRGRTRLLGGTDEEELDEFNIHVARHRPEELTKLAKTTKFSRKEIQLIYRGFKQECPTGMVDEESFKNIFSQFFPQGDASQYAHYVFNTIKHNQTGKISFEVSDE